MRGEPANSTDDRDSDRDSHEAGEELYFLRAFLAFTHACLVDLAEHEQHERDKRQNNDEEAPQIDALDIDGRMEPPIGERQDEHEHHRCDDDRALLKM